MGARLRTIGRRTPARLAVLALVATMAMLLAQAPSSAAIRPRGVDPRAAVPPVPTLVITLSQGVNADGALPIAARAAVIADVGWVQDRLAVTLPRIKWTGALPLVDGVFGPSTTAGVLFFKKWANNAHKLLHLPPLFSKVDGTVGNSTLDVLAIVAAYFQLHPGPGTVRLPESANQETEVLLMNQDRAHTKVAPMVANTQLMNIAQGFSNKLAAADNLSQQATQVTAGQLTSCATAVDEQQGEFRGGTIADLDTFMLNGANADPPVPLSDTVNPIYDQVGVGVSIASNGDLFISQYFATSC